MWNVAGAARRDLPRYLSEQHFRLFHVWPLDLWHDETGATDARTVKERPSTARDHVRARADLTSRIVMNVTG